MSAVRVVFLGRLAKEDVTARLKEVSGIDVFVTEDFAEMLISSSSMPTAFGRTARFRFGALE